MEGTPVPGETLSVSQSGKRKLPQLGGKRLPLAGGGDQLLPGEKCPVNWAMGGALAHKSNYLQRTLFSGFLAGSESSPGESALPSLLVFFSLWCCFFPGCPGCFPRYLMAAQTADSAVFPAGRTPPALARCCSGSGAARGQPAAAPACWRAPGPG